MKIRIQIYTIFFASVFLFSCKKESSAPAFNDIPVVQSYLQAGSPASVSISKLVAMDPNAQYLPVNINALNVTITCNNISYPMSSTSSSSDSSYYINSSLIISDSTNYTLQFNYNGTAVTAFTNPPSKPKSCTQSATVISIAQRNAGGTVTTTTGLPALQPDPVTLTWANPDHSYYLVAVQNVEANPELINLADASQPARLFRSEPTQDISSLVNPRQFHYYGTHKLTIYHILPDYAALYKAQSNSSQNLTTSASSVTNGLGIFTGVNSTALYINVTKQ